MLRPPTTSSNIHTLYRCIELFMLENSIYIIHACMSMYIQYARMPIYFAQKTDNVFQQLNCGHRFVNKIFRRGFVVEKRQGAAFEVGRSVASRGAHSVAKRSTW